MISVSQYIIGTIVCLTPIAVLVFLVVYRITRNAKTKAYERGKREGWLSCEEFVLHKAACQSFKLHAQMTRWFQWPEDDLGKVR